MRWDYRIIQKEVVTGAKRERHYQIMEVNYDDGNCPDMILKPDEISFPTKSELREEVEMLIGALKKPIIDMDGEEVEEPIMCNDGVLVSEVLDDPNNDREEIKQWLLMAPEIVRKMLKRGENVKVQNNYPDGHGG